jgi:isocitrate dehydrogenase
MSGAHRALFAAHLSTTAKPKIVAPKMVYIQGEEMTRYCMQLVMDNWVKPHVDITNWEFYDLSCIARDKTEDKVLKDAVEAGKRIGAIFKVFLDQFLGSVLANSHRILSDL